MAGPKSLIKTITETAKDSSRVFFTQHAEQRMAERNITRQQIFRCLLHGQVIEGPAPDIRGGLSMTLEVVSAGDIVKVVAVLDEDQDGNLIVIVTTYN